MAILVTFENGRNIAVPATETFPRIRSEAAQFAGHDVDLHYHFSGEDITILSDSAFDTFLKVPLREKHLKASRAKDFKLARPHSNVKKPFQAKEEGYRPQSAVAAANPGNAPATAAAGGRQDTEVKPLRNVSGSMKSLNEMKSTTIGTKGPRSPLSAREHVERLKEMCHAHESATHPKVNIESAMENSVASSSLPLQAIHGDAKAADIKKLVADEMHITKDFRLCYRQSSLLVDIEDADDLAVFYDVWSKAPQTTKPSLYCYPPEEAAPKKSKIVAGLPSGSRPSSSSRNRNGSVSASGGSNGGSAAPTKGRVDLD